MSKIYKGAVRRKVKLKENDPWNSNCYNTKFKTQIKVHPEENNNSQL